MCVCVCWCLFPKLLPQITPCLLLCAHPRTRFPSLSVSLFSRLKKKPTCVLMMPGSCVTCDTTVSCPTHAIRGNPSIHHACLWQQPAFNFLCCCFHSLLHNQLFVVFKETQLRGSTEPALRSGSAITVMHQCVVDPHYFALQFLLELAAKWFKVTLSL